MQAAFLQGATRVTKKLLISKVQRPSGVQSMEQGWPLMLPRMPPRSVAEPGQAWRMAEGQVGEVGGGVGRGGEQVGGQARKDREAETVEYSMA
jgi:hypothetical protein